MKLPKKLFYLAVYSIAFLIISWSFLPKRCIPVTSVFLGQTQSICVSDLTAVGILQGAVPNDIKAFEQQKLDFDSMRKNPQQLKSIQ